MFSAGLDVLVIFLVVQCFVMIFLGVWCLVFQLGDVWFTPGGSLYKSRLNKALLGLGLR